MIELENVVTIHLDVAFVRLASILNSLQIVWLPHIGKIVHVVRLVSIFDLFEVVNKRFEFHLNVARVNIGAPDDLRVGTHLIWPLQTVPIVVQHCSRTLFVCSDASSCASIWIEGRLVQKSIHIHESSLLLKI